MGQRDPNAYGTAPYHPIGVTYGAMGLQCLWGRPIPPYRGNLWGNGTPMLMGPPPMSPYRGNLQGNGTPMLMGPPHNPIDLYIWGQWDPSAYGATP